MPRVSRRGAGDTVNAEGEFYKAALYLRLSDKEGRENVSESIQNQECLLLDFLKQNPELQYGGSYLDEGKTGTNFNRPAFIKLMEDAKNGKINCIIVKDLSRLGRNYLEMGYYIENIFPEWNLRLIAVNDHFDSMSASQTEVAYLCPLKNLMNENYAIDISKKERTAKEVLRKKGYFLGSYATYGYEKAKDDRHQLIIDAEAAEVVRLIFSYLEKGKSDLWIARYLNGLGIDSPAKYRYKKGVLHDEKYKHTDTWHRQTIARIATSELYIGNMVQGVKRCHGIRGKKVAVERNKWDIVEQSHEAIISQEQFASVQNIRKNRTRKIIKEK